MHCPDIKMAEMADWTMQVGVTPCHHMLYLDDPQNGLYRNEGAHCRAGGVKAGSSAGCKTTDVQLTTTRAPRSALHSFALVFSQQCWGRSIAVKMTPPRLLATCPPGVMKLRRQLFTPQISKSRAGHRSSFAARQAPVPTYEEATR
jgi:hypothetical protein